MDIRNGEIKRSVLVAQRSIVAMIQWCSADARPLPAPTRRRVHTHNGQGWFLRIALNIGALDGVSPDQLIVTSDFSEGYHQLGL
jgi:hypothetical protein